MNDVIRNKRITRLGEERRGSPHPLQRQDIRQRPDHGIRPQQV